MIFLPLPAPAILILNKEQNELSQKALRAFDLCPLEDPRKSVRNFRSYRQFSTFFYKRGEIRLDFILHVRFCLCDFQVFCLGFQFLTQINGKGRRATCLTSGCSVLLTAVMT